MLPRHQPGHRHRPGPAPGTRTAESRVQIAPVAARQHLRIGRGRHAAHLGGRGGQHRNRQPTAGRDTDDDPVPGPGPAPGQRDGGHRRPGLRPVRGHRDPGHVKHRRPVRAWRLFRPVEDRAAQHGRQRHLGQLVEPGDLLAVDVAGEDAADVVTGHQVKQGGLVIDLIVASPDGEVLEQQHRGTFGQPAQDPFEPAQTTRTVVTRLLQRLGRVKPDEMHAARGEGGRRRAETCLVAPLGGGVPPHVMIARHVPDPAVERGGQRPAVQAVFARQAGVGDVTAVQHQVRREPGDGAVHLGQPGRQPGPRGADVRVADHGETQRLSGAWPHRRPGASRARSLSIAL